MDEGYGSVVNDTNQNRLNGSFGTSTAAPTWNNNGKFGKALSFDGGDYVSFVGSNLDNIGATGDFSITFWNYQNSFSGVEVGVGQGYAGAPGGHTYGRWQVGTNGSKGWISLYGGASSPTYKQITGTIDLPINTWNQITAIFSRTEGKIKLYINGKYDSQLTWDGYIESVYANRFAFGYNSGNNSQYMSGLIDEVKVYSSALTDGEIKVDYNQNQTMQFGTLSSGVGNTASSNAASQEYCVPGDTTTCDSPIAEWSFNEGIGGTSFDRSGNGNNAIFYNTPTWTTGKIGNAIQLNGSNQRATGGTSISPTNITFESWIYRTSSAVNQGIIRKQSAYAVTLYNNTINVAPGNNWSFYDTTQTIPLNTWVHLSWTYDGSNMILYKDGMRVWSVGLVGSFPSNANNTWIGYDENNWWWGGKLDQIRIFNYARTPAQIAWDYNRGAPVASYDFDECQGTVIHDLSNNRLDGTLIVGAGGTQATAGTCSTTGTAWGNGSAGKYNSSLNFDGTDDYISVGTPPALSFISSRPNVTFSAWINLKSINIHDGIISNSVDGGGTGQRFTLTEYTGNKLRLVLGNNSAYSNYWTADNSITIGKWIHVVITINSNNELKFYIDGVLNNGVQTLTNDIGTSTANWIIGAAYNNPGYSIDGQIDDVKFFNYALTVEQVKTLFNNGAINFGPATGSP